MRSQPARRFAASYRSDWQAPEICPAPLEAELAPKNRLIKMRANLVSLKEPRKFAKQRQFLAHSVSELGQMCHITKAENA